MSIRIAELPDASIHSIKHVFFDLDGTVIKNDKTISAAVREAFRSLQNLGISYSAATGRPLFSVKDLLISMGVSTPCITSSGAIISIPGEKAIQIESFTTTQVNRIIERLKFYNLNIELHTADNYYVEKLEGVLQIHAELLEFSPIQINLADYAKTRSDFIKITTILSTADERIRYKQFCQEFPELGFYNASAGTSKDLLYCNITKEKNLRDKSYDFFLKLKGLQAHEICAIGDADSDLSYIQRSGLGVAMANSTELLLKNAKYITTSAEEDGVALLLKKLGQPQQY